MQSTQAKTPNPPTLNEMLTVQFFSTVTKVTAGALLAYTFTSINPMHAAGLCLFSEAVGVIAEIAANIFTRDTGMLGFIKIGFNYSGAVFFGSVIAAQYNFTILTPLQSLALYLGADTLSGLALIVGFVAYKTKFSPSPSGVPAT